MGTSENKKKTIKAILWSKTSKKKVNVKGHVKNVIEKVKLDYGVRIKIIISSKYRN